MELTQQSWSKVTKSIYTAVLIYAVGNVVVGVLGPICSLVNTGSNIMSLATSGTLNSGPSGLDIFMTILRIAVLVGFILYLKGLIDFKKILNPENAAGIGKVFNGTILNIVGALVAFIPLLGWLGAIIIIIGFVLTMLGFMALKDSKTFPAKGRKGASSLFIAMLLSVIGGLLAFIPIIGGFIAMIVAIIVFFMTISGWASIKNANIEEI